MARLGHRSISRQSVDPEQDRRDAEELANLVAQADNRGAPGTLAQRTRILNIYQNWLEECQKKK